MDEFWLADRIRDLRAEKHLSAEALAKRAGVSSRTIEYIESGRGAKFTTVVKVAAGLGMTMAKFTRGI